MGRQPLKLLGMELESEEVCPSCYLEDIELAWVTLVRNIMVTSVCTQKDIGRLPMRVWTLWRVSLVMVCQPYRCGYCLCSGRYSCTIGLCISSWPFFRSESCQCKQSMPTILLAACFCS